MGIEVGKKTTIIGDDGSIFPSLRELAKESGKSRSYVKKKLLKGGFSYGGVKYVIKGYEGKPTLINENRVLVIPDLHAPFIKEGYLDFCKSIAKKYNTNKTIFLGDILDNHFSSYHETQPDGYGAGEELDRAIDMIQDWYKAFPNAVSLLGNHGAIIERKFVTAGISKKWLKSYKEVLKTPNWHFCEDYEFDGVLYVHGEGRNAMNACRDEMQSVVQGHRHSESYIKYFASPKQLCFAMQLGCGIDRKAYSMAYAKHFKKPQINCGVVLENGRYGIIEVMDIGV